MVSRSEAEVLMKQNHPALAGFIFDGEISELDLLAGIFQLIENKNILPVFEDNDIRRRLVALKVVNGTTESKFDRVLLKTLFEGKQEVTTTEVGSKIADEGFRMSMNLAFQLISGIKIEKTQYQKKLGKGYVDVISKAGEVKNSNDMNKYIKAGITSLLFGIIFVILNILKPPKDNDLLAKLVDIGILVFFVSWQIWTIFFAKYSVKVDFADNERIKTLRVKYGNLFEFLNTYPLSPHTFTNEFLAFAIAFGIDQSWNSDFGLAQFSRLSFSR